MEKLTVSTAMSEVREAAKALGIRFVGVTKESLVAQINEANENVQVVETPAPVEVVTETATETTTEVVAETPKTPGVSRHFNHRNCQELVSLMEKIDVNTAVVYRGVKNPQAHALVTEKENELLTAFVANGYNIKKTGETLGFSHTNVWQRLYGTPEKKEKAAKGILGKLREYANGEYVTEAPVVEDTEVQEAV